MPFFSTRPMPGLRRTLTLCAIAAAATAGSASAESYYVNATLGDDRNDGLSDAKAWRSLARVRDFALQPGDRILLASGSVWKEPLVISRSGKRNAPIAVDRTGTGARPRIDAGGVSPHAVLVRNAEYVTVSGLELTNDSPLPAPRYGVLVSAENSGVMRGIRISDLYIHDIRGTNDRKDNGGIVFQALGPRLATRFEDLRVERNIIWRVDRSGIAGISDQISAARWFPSRHVVISDNYLEDIGGDGIVPRGADGTLVEHNIVRAAASRAPGYNVAIWQWSTDNSLLQLNEAAFTKGRFDGQGFDSDFNSRRTRILYNYSHDNAGGFLLICSPRSNETDNLGNRGTIARYNVSRNDGTRIIQLSGAITDALIEKNVIHVGKGMDVQMVVATEWQGWASDVRVRDNVFAVAGTVRYGREVGRNGPDYLIAPGFAPVEQIKFDGNRYYGRHIDVPPDDNADVKLDYRPPVANWAVPTFDPAKPDGFAAFLPQHRNWMMAMLSRELGRPVDLERPRPSSPFETRR